MKEQDLIIVGAGIAGVSASMYAKRAGLDLVLFEKAQIGGQLMYTEKVENYAGLAPLGGADLSKKLSDNLAQLEVPLISEHIERVQIEDKIITLSSRKNTYTTKTLIVASGASFRKLGLTGEEKFCGRGVSYCAVCDGFFFKGKDVCVVGGGNTAVEDASYLANLCQKVYLIHRRDKLRALDYLQQELLEKENVEILYNSTITSLQGDDFLKGVTVKQEESERTIETSGLFVAIGISPNTGFIKEYIEVDEGGFIITDETMQSSGERIFACGDCRKRPLRQLITAAGEGAIAALSAYKYLRGTYISV